MDAWKNLAEDLLVLNKQCFIKDIENNYYFGEVLLVGDYQITIYCNAPEQRAGTKQTLYWSNIIKFTDKKEKLKEERENGTNKNRKK